MSAVKLALAPRAHALLDKAMLSTAHDSAERPAKALTMMLRLTLLSQTTYLCLLCL